MNIKFQRVFGALQIIQQDKMLRWRLFLFSFEQFQFYRKTDKIVCHHTHFLIAQIHQLLAFHHIAFLSPFMCVCVYVHVYIHVWGFMSNYLE